MKTNGIPVALGDIPARNGVVHFVSRLINPLKKDRKARETGDWDGVNGFDVDEDEEDWENWREWLPQWAEEV